MISAALVTDYLLEWFPDHRIGSGGSELIANSPFGNDYKMKFSVNTQTGLWQDFSEHTSGNFVHLYAHFLNISRKKAYSDLVFQSFFEGDTPPKVLQDSNPTEFYDDELGDVEALNQEFDALSPPAQLAFGYLVRRRILTGDYHSDSNKFLFCKTGKFASRLIIPVYHEDKMVFFQARALHDWDKPKYLTPHKMKASQILPPFDYESDHVVVTEGPMDWLSLKVAGYNATCVFGSSVSKTQIDNLYTFPGKIIIAFDNDEAGRKGVARFNSLRKQKRVSEFWVAKPPNPYKDWNELWVKEGKIDLMPIKHDLAYEVNTKLGLQT